MKHTPAMMFIPLIAAGALLVLTTPVDYAWTAWLAANKVETFAEIMAQSIFEMEMPGGGDVVVIFLITVVGFYYAASKAEFGSRLYRLRPAIGFLVAAAIVTAVFNVHSLKWVMGRARPDAVFSGQLPFTAWFTLGPQLMSQGVFHGSFPSGHTALAFTPFALTYVLAGRHQTAAVAFGAASVCLAVAMGVARCMTTSHWVSDVAGSLMLSAAAMHLLYYRLMRVPDQEALMAAENRLAGLPRGWELLMVFFVGLVYVGAMALMCGMRILWHQGMDAWILLLPAGICLLWTGTRYAFRLIRQLYDALDAALIEDDG